MSGGRGRECGQREGCKEMRRDRETYSNTSTISDTVLRAQGVKRSLGVGKRKDLGFDTASALLPQGCGLWTLSCDFARHFLLKR